MAKRRSSLLRRARRWVRDSAANASEVVRLGRLVPAYHAPFEVLEQEPTFRLRRYVGEGGAKTSAPLLLVPPLMLTAEIYDVSPELSAATFLVERGIDTWVVDFGAPEREPLGMSRTLDDHVRAVSRAIDRVREITKRDVHLAGYSQGGMFAYQTAAYRRSEGVASVITFGSPVDIHRNVPNVASDVVGIFARAVRPLMLPIVQRIEGLPGALTSVGFKVLTPRKEIEQLIDFVRKLSDRQALEKRESRRRFLGGEGFVAWPGPALRTFLDEFVVHNRMISGGMVIDGRTVTLADITCPVLAFVGSRDTFARPGSVRAVSRAAPRAEVSFVPLDAGHFGLVVGGRALADTWPTVAEWVDNKGGGGPTPRLLRARPPAPPGEEADELDQAWLRGSRAATGDIDFDVEIDLAFDVVTQAFERVFVAAADAVRGVGDAALAMRFQVPRLRQLEAIDDDTRLGPGLELAKKAHPERRDHAAGRSASGDAGGGRTFFLSGGRAFSYADADERVNHVVLGLLASGVRAGDRTLVAMTGRPSFLSVVTALDRLGAVPVVIPPGASEAEIARVLADAKVAHVVADPEHAAAAHRAFGYEVLVLGGGAAPRALGPGLVDMEAIDTSRLARPPGFSPNAGRARDLAAILALRGAGDGDGLRLAPITRHRWALSAIGAAAACTLRPEDTVYCCLPLHHPAGLLVSVGGALVSGARLALAATSPIGPHFDPATFWAEVRRYGVTVVFYAGEMARALLDAPPTPHDRDHPVRLFAGSGMREDLWRRLAERFGIGVLEFYAATTQNVVLANASGEKVGAIGRPLPGSAEIAIARCDLATRAPVRDAGGKLVRAAVDEPGLALARLGPHEDAPASRVCEGAFDVPNAAASRWFVSHDLLRRDADGDFWFVDRVAGMIATPGGDVSSRAVEDALYRLAEVRLAACQVDATFGIVATVLAAGPLDAERVTRVLGEALPPHARPRRIRRAASMPMTDGFQPIAALAGEALETLAYDDARGVYVGGAA